MPTFPDGYTSVISFRSHWTVRPFISGSFDKIEKHESRTKLQSKPLSFFLLCIEFTKKSNLFFQKRSRYLTDISEDITPPLKLRELFSSTCYFFHRKGRLWKIQQYLIILKLGGGGLRTLNVFKPWFCNLLGILFYFYTEFNL